MDYSDYLYLLSFACISRFNAAGTALSIVSVIKLPKGEKHTHKKKKFREKKKKPKKGIFARWALSVIFARGKFRRFPEFIGSGEVFVNGGIKCLKLSTWSVITTERTLMLNR